MVSFVGLTPRKAVQAATQRLQAAECPDADFDALQLVRLVLGRDVRTCVLPLTEQQAETLESYTARRESREPLQYICGSWPFLDFELAVGPGVLCPRADTETILESLQTVLKEAPRKVLDLCAGTGALGIGCKRFWPSAQVTCVEKSPKAFQYLEKNAVQALRPLTVQAEMGDLFTWHESLESESLDVILCNPPYLTADEMDDLQPEVAQEPAMALDGGTDGLVFYRALAQQYLRPMRPGGWLALEIGWEQAEQVEQLLQDAGWTEVQTKKDYAGNDRCVLARRPL